MFRNQMMQRLISACVLTTFTSLTMYPLTATAQARDAIEKAGLLPKVKDEGIVGNAKRYINKLAGNKASSAPPTADERFAQLLNEIHEDLKAVVPQSAMSKDARKFAQTAQTAAKKGDKQTRAIGPNMRIETENTATLKPLPGTDIAARVKSIKNKAAEVKGLYAEIDKSFKETEQHLKDAKLPQQILDRQAQAVAQYEGRKAEFDRLLGKVEQATANSADQQTALADMGSFMAKYPNAKPHQYTDPNKLPFGANNGKVRAPNLTKEQYQASLFPPKYKKIMLAGVIPDGLQLAQATLPEVPNAPDTAETEDAQITPAIRAQAVALNNNPVKIYNWVRNNIQFIPSYGSIQGSDLTLMNKRGNAFDTASLLIALYRASNIPARYVYGTIEVPADKVMNWVGGVTKTEAAQSLLGQGGIPNVALVSGGTVKAIRMEHVWVEAFVDYNPSRGAANKVPGTWVPMDASFKQYQFTSGMDIKNNVQLNAQGLLDQIKQGATVNEAQGYAQNLNQANLQMQLATYQNQVKTYIDNRKANATIGDVLGAQAIVAENRPILLGTLPYKLIAQGSTFQSLPDILKWKFKTNVYAADGVSDGSSPIIELNQSTAKLAGKKITLSFVPASEADQSLINSYLPKPHADGTPVQTTELPSSLPGYLLNMKAELRVDGLVVAQTTNSFTMGSTVRQSNQYFNPSNGTWEGGEDNDITVGEYNAIGTDLQGIGSQQLEALNAKIGETRAKIDQFQKNPSDGASVLALSKEDLTGDFVQSGIVGYFAQVDNSDALTARTAGNVKTYRLPSYGRFFTAVQPRFWFGVVKTVSFPGVAMDVDYVRYHTVAANDSQATILQFMRQVGLTGSAAENAVPEAMFRNVNLSANDSTQPQGVSSTKALGIAAAQGQKIYTLNSNNQTMHSSILQNLQISEDVKSEISYALTIGKEVMVHEKDIAVSGWTGSGYIILDRDTGSGAYKIAGGTNGGYVPFPATLLGMLLGLLGGIAAIVMSSLALAVIAGIAAFIAGQLLLATYNTTDRINFNAGRFLGIVGGMGLALILGEFVIFTLSPLFVIGFVFLMLSLLYLLTIEIMTATANTYLPTRYALKGKHHDLLDVG